MSTFNTSENCYFVFVKSIDEFKENRKLLKYCFLMQEYRQTPQTKESTNINEERLFKFRTDCLAFSIEKKITLGYNCRLVDNQSYKELDLGQFMEKVNCLVKSSLDSYKVLLLKIKGEQITSFFFVL